MKKNRLPQTYVMGDLHSNYKGLIEALQKTNFDYENDILYFVGDLCDGIGNECYECMKELLKIKNFFPCMGNHDLFLKKWVLDGVLNKKWLEMNGDKTIENLMQYEDYKDLTFKYFEKVKSWYLINNNIICHGGLDLKKPVNNQKELIFSINRDLYKKAKNADKQKTKLKIRYNIENDIIIKNVIIGHTPTKNNLPDFVSNVINIDTGSGRNGRLTFFNLKTKEYYQTQTTKKLYK